MSSDKLPRNIDYAMKTPQFAVQSMLLGLVQHENNRPSPRTELLDQYNQILDSHQRFNGVVAALDKYWDVTIHQHSGTPLEELSSILLGTAVPAPHFLKDSLTTQKQDRGSTPRR